MNKFLKFFAKTLIAFLGLWCVVASILAIYDVSLYFPFYISEGEEMPYHRMVALRVTILLTFAFYSLKYLIFTILILIAQKPLRVNLIILWEWLQMDCLHVGVPTYFYSPLKKGLTLLSLNSYNRKKL